MASSQSSITAAPRWRGRTASVLLVVGCVMLLLANVALFLRLFIFDRDTFTDAVAPKEPDEQVVSALSTTLTNRLFDNTQVQQRIQDLTPNDNALVAAVVTNSARTVIRGVMQNVMESDAFRTVWRTAVEDAHDRFVDIVDDDSSHPVVLNLTSFIGQADQVLESRGIDLLDDSTIQEVGEVVAVRKAQLDEVRTGLEWLKKSSVAGAILAVALLGGAVLLATDRRRMLARLGVGITLAMVVTGVAMRIARTIVLNRFENATRRDAVESLWGRVFTELDRQTWALLALGVILAIGAWALGPSRIMTTLRQKVAALRNGSPESSSETPAPA